MATKRRAEITDESIATLPFASGTKRYSMLDPDCRGLVIRVAKKSRSYHLQMRDAYGRPRRWFIADCAHMRLEDARAKVAEWRVVAKQGPDPKKEDAARTLAALENTFAKAAESFVVRHLKPKNRTWQQSARLLGLVPDGHTTDPDNPKKQRMKFKYLKDTPVKRWADRTVDSIGRGEIAAVLDSYTDRDKPIMANRVFATLRKLFNWLLSRGVIETNPCAGMSPPSQENERDRVLEDSELVRVWNGAETLGYPFGPIIHLLILTGQRRSEVAGMRWSELDLNNRIWTLPKGRVKNKNGHAVPLSERAVAILSRQKRVKGCDLVFTHTGETEVSGFSKAKAAMDNAAEIPEWRIHDLRRTAATGMAALGTSLPVIEKILNHTSGTFKGVVKIYQRFDFAEQKRAALDLWAQHVEGLLAPKHGQTNVALLSNARMRNVLS